MFKINLSRQAQKSLQNLPAKQAKQIAQKLMDMRENPRPNDSKKLVGSAFVRADSGEYRIIYDINIKAQTLEILIIGKRNDDEVYRKLRQKHN
ncbi:MAG: type II toxin-antitoxin system RelE/ParE family toxin [Gammaproteobacteria bacterium]|nr:type II toxin-antitoxin system RelE/ParE family toxin [Gammaproteobacteria bacterium]